MVVVYYTSTGFLDVIIETIQSIKKEVELHVIIEITPSSKSSTIVDVANLDNFNMVEKPEMILGNEKWQYLKPYFEGVASVEFVVHKNKKAFSLRTLKTAFSLGRYLKKYKANVLHFDSISTCSIGLYFYALTKKMFITVHDPAPHSGERSWRERILKSIFFPLAKGYFFYSAFAEKQFTNYYKKIKKPLHVIKLQPYSYVTRFLSNKQTSGKNILFFGRLSVYKGIDILLEAIPIVLAKFPNEKFVIAGHADYGYKIDEQLINKYSPNIQIIKGYLNTEELVKKIEEAKFIICPYRDATQSGVVMTALAAGKMVIATNVGSFSEYIHNGENGLLSEPNAPAVASKIIEALQNDNYKIITQKVVPGYSKKYGDENQRSILNAYKNQTEE